MSENFFIWLFGLYATSAINAFIVALVFAPILAILKIFLARRRTKQLLQADPEYHNTRITELKTIYTKQRKERLLDDYSDEIIVTHFKEGNAFVFPSNSKKGAFILLLGFLLIFVTLLVPMVLSVYTEEFFIFFLVIFLAMMVITGIFVKTLNYLSTYIVLDPKGCFYSSKSRGKFYVDWQDVQSVSSQLIYNSEGATKRVSVDLNLLNSGSIRIQSSYVKWNVDCFEKMFRIYQRLAME